MAKQRSPRSLRLSEEEEKKSDQIAKRLGLKWHSWAMGVLRDAIATNKYPKRVKRLASDHSQQERVT